MRSSTWNIAKAAGFWAVLLSSHLSPGFNCLLGSRFSLLQVWEAGTLPKPHKQRGRPSWFGPQVEETQSFLWVISMINHHFVVVVLRKFFCRMVAILRNKLVAADDTIPKDRSNWEEAREIRTKNPCPLWGCFINTCITSKCNALG